MNSLLCIVLSMLLDLSYEVDIHGSASQHYPKFNTDIFWWIPSKLFLTLETPIKQVTEQLTK